MTREQCLTCGEWFEDSEMDVHLAEHLNKPESEEKEERSPPAAPLPQRAEFDRMSSFGYSTPYSPEETLSRAATHLRSSGYSVRVQGSTLQALSGTPTASFIGLVLFLGISIYELLARTNFWYLFLLPIGPIIWFRRKNQIEITIFDGRFVIEPHGTRAVRDAERLSNFLRE